MKLINTNDLDWNNPDILDYRYIDHLTKMINERWIEIGYTPITNDMGYMYNTSKWMCVGSGSKHIWTPHRFSPGGFLTWDQLSQIYSATLYLAIYVYINEANFKEENFENSDNRLHFGYSLPQLCEITDFDFFANPFIPGHPIQYYTKFLAPLRKILLELKKVWSNIATYQNEKTFRNYISSFKSSFFPKIGDNSVKGKDRYEAMQNFTRIKGYVEDTLNGGSIYNDIPYNLTYYALYAFTNITSRTDYWQPSYDEPNEWVKYYAWYYNSIGVKNKGKYKFAYYFKPGASYKTYLIASTYTKNIENFIPVNGLANFYWASSWGKIIEGPSGNVPNNGMVTHEFSLPNWDLPNKNDLPSYIDLKDFQETNQSSQNKYEDIPFYKRGVTVGCQYIPMIIVDYSGTFNYN